MSSAQSTPPPLPPRDNQARKRLGCSRIIEGCVVLVILFVLYMLLAPAIRRASESRDRAQDQDPDHGKAELARADGLWLEGKQAEAVSIYIDKLAFVDDTEKPEVFKRVITHLYDSGDKVRATEYYNKAIAEGLHIEFDYSDLRRYFEKLGPAITDRKETEVRRLAEEMLRNKLNWEEMYQFYWVVSTVGRHEVIADLFSEREGPNNWRLTIIVNEGWDALPKGTRLEYAKTFRGAWSDVCAPVQPEIEILKSGNKIGGATWSESSVWVD